MHPAAATAPALGPTPAPASTPTPTPTAVPGPVQADTALTAARTEGLAAGLRAVIAAGTPITCSANGFTLLPSGSAVDVSAWLVHGRVLPPDAVTHRASVHPLAATEGLERVQVTARPGPAVPVNGGTALHPSLALAAVRLGLSIRLLATAAAYLSTRESEGRPLIERQLVQGSLADTASAIELCRDALAITTLDATVGTIAVDLHTRLDRVGWTITTMFGGSGYLRDHDVRALYVAHLVHDAWVVPGIGGGSW